MQFHYVCVNAVAVRSAVHRHTHTHAHILIFFFIRTVSSLSSANFLFSRFVWTIWIGGNKYPLPTWILCLWMRMCMCVCVCELARTHTHNTRHPNSQFNQVSDYIFYLLFFLSRFSVPMWGRNTTGRKKGRKKSEEESPNGAVTYAKD